MVSGEARRYHVLSVLGRGAFGTVYRARAESDGGFSQMVALKLLHPDKEADPDLTRRLRDEARVLALVRHRAIVHVHGLAYLSGRWGVVMELVEGVDLRAVLSRGPLPARVAAAIAAEVATALNVAWTTPGPGGEPLRLVHRDIKPSNLYLTAHGEVKVLDFGIARADALDHSGDAGLLFGTEAYMSPERRDYRDGPEGDVYGLGAVLYELVTGQMFGATFVRAERHQEKLANALALLPEDGPAGVAGLRLLLGEMLAFDAEARPTAADVRRRLLRLVGELTGPDLEEWAEKTIPKLLAAQVAPAPVASDPVGTTLTERPMPAPAVDPLTLVPEADEPGRVPTLAPPAPEPPPAPPRPPAAPSPAAPSPGASSPVEPPEQGGLPGWLLVAWAGLAVLLVAGLGWAWSMYAAAPEAADLPPVETRVADPEPTPAPPVEAAPSPVEPAPAAVATAPAPVPTATPPARTPKAEPPAPEEPARAPTTGTLRVEGDAALVELRAGATRRRAGVVPTGTYEVWADFGDGQARQQGRVTVRAGETSVVKCSAVQGRCVTRTDGG